MKEQDPQNHIDIELNDEVAEGIYSNLVMIAHSSEEFILDYIRVMPGVPKARVKTRVIVTPQHAKRLLHALQDNIARYEQTYGYIPEHVGPGEPVQFGGIGGEA